MEAKEFADHLVPFLHEKTAHFLHEFSTYARCPYDVIAYDKRVKYNFAGGDRWDPEAIQVIPPSTDPSGAGTAAVGPEGREESFDLLTRSLDVVAYSYVLLMYSL